jgi:outer membrane lipoprotein-sorting protein
MMSRLSHLRRLAPLALALALPLSFVLPAAVSSAPAATDARLTSAVTALRSISSLKADFTQTDRNGQRVSGVLTLQQPGRIRFEYAKGVNMLIVSDGTTLTLVDYDVSQVQRWPIRNSPLGALLDPKRDVAQFGKVQPSASPDVISVEVRDPKRPEFGMITVILVRKAGAPGGFELTSWVALDSQNKRTTVRLANHRYGMAVPGNAFTFRDPRKTTRRPG